MKKLTLTNISYKYLIHSFREWLEVLGYAETTVYNLPNQLQEFLHYLENKGIHSIDLIHTQTVTDYYKHLQTRNNQRLEGALSKSYLNKHQQALKKFNEYLKEHNSKGFNIHLRLENNPTEERVNILTITEVKKLFKACEYSHGTEPIRIRDKALLTVLYSCGLRRNEVVNLDLSDVLFDRGLIYVRKGKNYKERFVPINKVNLSMLEEYIYEARPYFNINDLEALFLTIEGKRLLGGTIANRVREIAKSTADESIIEKHLTPHSLRHAIATHLLQENTPLESIKTFLGHTSLESTQIYVHLLNMLDND